MTCHPFSDFASFRFMHLFIFSSILNETFFMHVSRVGDLRDLKNSGHQPQFSLYVKQCIFTNGSKQEKTCPSSSMPFKNFSHVMIHLLLSPLLYFLRLFPQLHLCFSLSLSFQRIPLLIYILAIFTFFSVRDLVIVQK